MNNQKRRKVCVVLVDRANYGRIKPVMQAIKNTPQLELQVVVAGTMVLERFGQPMNILQEDGLPIDGEIYIELEGSKPITMAKAVGFGIIEFASEFQRLMPDIVLLIGDRYEMLSATVAAAYMNICIVHLQGGEVSGSIDESARHSISKFAQFHVPSTQRAAHYLCQMGERPETILTIGCPSSDIARESNGRLSADIINRTGSGAIIDVTKPFLLVVFHPTTTEYGSEAAQMDELLQVLDSLKMQTVMLWSNIDAGSDHISKEVRKFRDQHKDQQAWLRVITNLKPEDYLKVLANAACAVGNSSSFVRDAGYFGTPVVLVGNRQKGREYDEHVMPVPVESAKINEAVCFQLKHGKYAPSQLYGDGFVSQRVAEALIKLSPYIQKQLSYINEENGDFYEVSG